MSSSCYSSAYSIFQNRRRQGTEEFNLDNDTTAPYERERSQPRGMASSRAQQQRGQSQQSSKPVM